jgi:hypothetical protein
MSNVKPTEFVREHAPWSYSKASVASQCPFKFKLQYIDKKKTYPSADAIVGQAVHKALEYALTNRPVKACFEIAITEDERLTSNEIERIEGFIPSAQKFIRRFNAYRTKYPAYEPKLEQRFGVGFDGKLAKFFDNTSLLRGVVDVYMLFKKNPDCLILDHKTGKAHDLKYFTDQFNIYTLLLKAKEPNLERVRVGLNFLKTDEIVLGKLQDVRDIQPVMDKVVNFLNASTKETHKSQLVKQGPLCKWCDYQQEYCPAFAGGDNGQETKT